MRGENGMIQLGLKNRSWERNKSDGQPVCMVWYPGKGDQLKLKSQHSGGDIDNPRSIVRQERTVGGGFNRNFQKMWPASCVTLGSMYYSSYSLIIKCTGVKTHIIYPLLGDYFPKPMAFHSLWYHQFSFHSYPWSGQVLVSFLRLCVSIPTDAHKLLIKYTNTMVTGFPYSCNTSFSDYQNKITALPEWSAEQNLSVNLHKCVDVAFSVVGGWK